MTAMLSLRYVIGDARVDQMLREGVRTFEAAFPGRIRAYYLIGSHADGSATSASDVDVCVVFKDDYVDRDEEEYAHERWRSLTYAGPVRFDLPSFSERHLLIEGHHRIKTASVLLAGEDIRARMPPMTRDAYLRTYWHAPHVYMAQVLRATDRLVVPLSWPDAGGEFFGYDRLEAVPGAIDAPSTKALVATACWIATMIVGLRAGQMVGTKAESVRRYRDVIGDSWTGLIEDLYVHGKQAWDYRIPESAADRALLRGLCARMLAFENHYLTIYRTWLLDHARSPDASRKQFAAVRLAEVVYPDATVHDALAMLAGHPDPAVRDPAGVAIACRAEASAIRQSLPPLPHR
jgi:hypothetical protein